MAGTDPGFNGAEFREAIHFAMQLGAAVEADEQPSFHFPNQLVYNTSVDGANVPFDPAATVTNSTPDSVQVDCAIEYLDVEDQSTPFGLMAPTKVAITLLDEDYQQVAGCSHVVIHGDRYDYRRTEPPSGLFDVGVYVMHFTSAGES